MEQIPPIEPELNTVIVKPTKNNSFLIIFLSVLLLISILIAGFFAYQTQKLNSELRMISDESKQSGLTPTLSVTPNPTTSQTPNGDLADWKTYTDNKLGFSIKYPQTFNVYETKEGPASGERIDFSVKQPYLQNKYWFWVSVTPNSNLLTAEAAANNYLNAKSTYKDGKYVSINDQPEIATKFTD
ncbi:MAG: hypothetical protein U0946_03255 [Patescibacteria group bacterium]|nr:hypothetical protein [Patescibacteria group bacterium]